MIRVLLALLFGLNIHYASFAQEADALPPINKEIMSYVETTIGQKVDRGECWDLLNQALNRAEADWHPPFDYGRKLDYKEETVLPGDMVQFENVKLTSPDGYNWTFPQHSAVVYANKGDGIITIAHQNIGNTKKVMLTDIDLNNIDKGKLLIYRPVPKQG